MADSRFSIPDESQESLLHGSFIVNGRETLNRILPQDLRNRKYLAIAGATVLLALVGLFVWLRSPPPRIKGPLIVFPPAKLDLEYTSHRNLDIVVSHYSESLSDLLTSLSSIIAIPSIAALTPRITVYTKHPTIPLSEIATALSLPESSIKRLPNKGREGGTYLSHILGNWDDLAAHTLFLQAEVHNSFYLQRRLREFFDVKKTGYLPLGFSGKFCELTDCTDEWDWKDRYHHIPALYTLRYGVFAPPGKMSLSYKGQFVVSAKRVRGVGRDTMLYLRDVLEGGASPYSRKNPEVPDLPGMEGNAPSFGFVLERVWGMVFGCADGRMAVDCPSLWRARKKGEGDDTCQCLDRA